MSALMEQGIRQVGAGLECMATAADESGEVSVEKVLALAAKLRESAEALERLAGERS